ncbi:MAG: hypothetical protein JWR80_4392 [Bradyrhizobium sp.]|nr:hypothetical protein [Bradyrhizobium sp.]
MKNTLLAATLLLGIASPAVASDAPTRRFTRDGETYIYTAAMKDGRILLSGRARPSGSAFELVVAKNRVIGTFAGQPVSFERDQTQRPLSLTDLAAR